MLIINTLGSFKICISCKFKGECCYSFDKINNPCLNEEELIQIKKNNENDNFFLKIDDGLFNLKTIRGKCIFLKNGKCSIYQNRPTDCKLFPFDIIKQNSKYYLILYSLNCYDNSNIQEDMSNLDDLINSIIPWIEKFTDERNYTKMKKLKYQIIKEITINKEL